MTKKFRIPTKKAGKFELPVLGLGTYRMGGTDQRDPDNDDLRDVKSIRDAVELGITHIDTAESYAAGYTEELLGRALKMLDRKKLLITSKVHTEHLGYDDIIKACKKSLERIGTEYLDLYLIHHPNPEIPLKETMRAMDFLYEEGLIKNIGVSNFHVPLLKEAKSYTKNKIVNNQIHFNLSARAYEENGTLDYCRENNILVTAYRPIAKGEFASTKHNILNEIAEKYKKSPVQIAINWIINKPNIVTIVKTDNKEQMEENLGAIGWKLKKQDEELLDKEFPRGETIYLPAS